MQKYVTEINKKYHFQSPPIDIKKIKLTLKDQDNRNCSFDQVSTKTFYHPCKKSKYRNNISETIAPDLEEISDRKILSHFLATDAEETQLSPNFPKFVNRVETKDVQTQTETCDKSPVPYVYHFYIEVVPILERLVGYTIELAMTELESEEEVLLRHKVNKTFKEIVAPERVEVNRRREETYRLNEEIRRRIIELAVKDQDEISKLEIKENIKLAETLAKEVLNFSINKLYGETEKVSTNDPIEFDIQENFLPVLFQEAYSCPILSTDIKARICLDGLIRDACNERNY